MSEKKYDLFDLYDIENEIKKIDENIQRTIQKLQDLEDKYSLLEMESSNDVNPPEFIKAMIESGKNLIIILKNKKKQWEKIRDKIMKEEEIFQEVKPEDIFKKSNKRGTVADNLQFKNKDKEDMYGNEYDDNENSGAGKKRTKIISVQFPKDSKFNTSVKRLNFIKNKLGLTPIKRAHNTPKYVKYRILESNSAKKHFTKKFDDVSIIFERL